MLGIDIKQILLIVKSALIIWRGYRDKRREGIKFLIGSIWVFDIGEGLIRIIGGQRYIDFSVFVLKFARVIGDYVSRLADTADVQNHHMFKRFAHTMPGW